MGWSQPTALLWQQLILHLVDEHRVLNLKQKERGGERGGKRPPLKGPDLVCSLSTLHDLSSWESKKYSIFVLPERSQDRNAVILSGEGPGETARDLSCFSLHNDRTYAQS